VAWRAFTAGTAVTAVAVTRTLFTRFAVVAIAVPVRVEVAGFIAFAVLCNWGLAVFGHKHRLLRLTFALCVLSIGTRTALAAATATAPVTATASFGALAF
jgi:hypothetical protein